MRSVAKTSLPLPVRRALKKLGADLADARKRRRIPTALMAERMRVSRPTLLRVERGDGSVSLAVYATALFILGLHDRLGALADPGQDQVGLDLESERLPKRIVRPRIRNLADEQ